jgi:hypothetical protein
LRICLILTVSVAFLVEAILFHQVVYLEMKRVRLRIIVAPTVPFIRRAVRFCASHCSPRVVVANQILGTNQKKNYSSAAGEIFIKDQYPVGQMKVHSRGKELQKW